MNKQFMITGKLVKKVVLWLLLVGLVSLLLFIIVDSYGYDHAYSRSTISEPVIVSGPYNNYIEEHPDALTPNNVDIVLQPGDATGDFNVKDYSASYPATPLALETTSSGSATWSFNVPTAGFYNIKVDYIPEIDGGANIERTIYVNGSIPYQDLENVAFKRVWGDGGEIITDITGNQIRPRQIEIPVKRSSYVKDEVGYVSEPYLVYFSSGINTLTFKSLREAMSIFAVHIISKQVFKTYAEVEAEYETKGYDKVTGEIAASSDSGTDFIEGENAIYRSSPTIYATSDRSSAYNSPADPVKIILNSIGGSKWITPGDWITWEFTVPQSGLYNITLRAKQSTSRGLFSTRAVYVDGEVPFAEAQNAKFIYTSDFSMVTLGTEDKPFYFYLTEGTHQITLEATLGDYGAQIARVQNVIDNLNDMYRRIIAKTGINPDKYQDYQLTTKIPNLITTFQNALEELSDVADTINSISGEKSSETASLQTIMLQLGKFIKKPRLIQQNLGTFSTNISSLGTWILTVSRQSLVVDYLIVHSDDYDLPRANPNFFIGSWFNIKAFIQSFTFDYESIGTTVAKENAENIEVWLLTSEMAGREQANAIRTLIDSDFGEDLNITLKIVSPDVLLTATLAGKGPDIAINAANGLPVNYALRGATYDLSTFEDFEEVVAQFAPSSMTPYEFQGGYYGLPNTQSFLMLFYRTDIFEAQNWDVPETWVDVINLISELQIQNLKFYLPLNTVGASSVVNQVFASRLYQTGGSFYRNALNNQGEEYIESNFDSEEAMSAFEWWCDFYTNHSFSLTITGATFINRFRSGEMPIGIANYDLYNTLAVSAPEIKGRWAFALLPGTRQDDNTIDHSGAASGTSVVMMNDTDNPEAAWKFMKWWISTDTQTSYAREVEAILGSAARHPTANVEAFTRLAWTIEEQQILLSQWEVTVGVPEIAGGYYTGRNLENAFREVVNNNYNPRNTFEQYIQTINNEITRKREEFGLPVGSDE
ncbi:MAG: extracellular solute-binding protein [Bacilli bacterium]|nr:extracellular solute-binding protein [Bacilli bacterium]